MTKKMRHCCQLLLLLFMPLFLFGLVYSPAMAAGPLIVDHNCTDISQIPDYWINQAKTMLRLSYGHTSHGSQIVTGMSLLRGASGSLYWYDHHGTADGLSLHDGEPSGDLGNPDRTTWAARTRTLLNTSGCDRNMIMWSWCGQVSNATHDDIANSYLTLMNQLETDYPDVTFVYMTGHLDGTGEEGNLNVRNNQIRQYCMDNNKILYDFADIESYDPDGYYFLDKGATDSCNYHGGNWANEWCDANPGECASCSCAHSRCLNCQLKGRAFWYMMARLAGWKECLPAPSGLTAAADSINQEITLGWMDNSGDPNEDYFIIQRQVHGGAWDNSHDTVAADTTSYIDTGLTVGTYNYRVVAHLNDDGTGNPCDSGPSNIASADIVSTDPPLAPSDLGATGDSQNRSIALNWTDNSGNETGFIIQRQVDGGAWTNDYATAGGDETVYDDQNLLPGVYNYRVVAYNNYGNSDPSNEAEDTILDLPFAPTNLQVTGDSPAGTVSLTWTDNSGNETGFIIQRQVDGETWDNNYATVGVDSTSYLDNNGGSPPLPNGTYNYRVAAFNGDGESNPSNEDAAVISQEAPDDPSDLESSLSGFDITLTWTDNSDNEENFILERKIDDGSFIVLDDTLSAGAEAYLDSGLQSLHTYTYRVKARNNYGDSGYSNETSEYIAEEEYTITLKQNVDGYTGCNDAYLDSAYPTYNYGGDRWNYVENSPKCNFVISFDLPSEVMEKKILEAKLVFYCWSVSSWQDNQYLDLHRLTEEWEEGTADGAYQSGSTSWEVRGDGSGDVVWTTPGGSFDSTLLDSSLIPNNSYYPEFDITNLLQEWVDGVVSNYGVLLKNDTTVRTGIKASEYSENRRPYMEVTYTNKPPCTTDYDDDGDVDGSDLAAFAADFDEDCLDEFAADYGQ